MARNKFWHYKNEEIKRFYPYHERGLTNYQVNLRESQHKINKVDIKVNRSYLDIIIKNVFTFFNILLIVLGIILIAAGKWSSCVFLGILACNTAIGLFQDIRAKIAVDKLSLTQKEKVRVVREGKIRFVDPENIVLDDVIILRNDENVPCDGIVLSGEARLNESLLTGESVPSKKIAGSQIYSGTYIISGEIYVRVDKVGNDNYINSLQAKSKEFRRPKSQIYAKLNYLFKIIAVVVILIGLVMIVEFSVLQNAFNSWNDFVNSIGMIAGSLVSMIPSGMYLLASTSLAVGTIALTKRKVLVRDLYSTETLARVDTLCIDKTGTMTDGTMSVYGVEMLKGSKFTKDQLGLFIGGILRATKDSNLTAMALEKEFGRKEIFKVKNFVPFDSSIKYSAASFVDYGTIVMGALGFFDLENNKEITRKINAYNKEGFRTLAVGYSPKNIDKNGKIPTKMTPIAIIVLQDHIRSSVKKTIAWFNENNVNIKVISGDNPITVSKIAEVVGIKDASKYISLEGMSLEEVKEIVDDYNIFGRVSPEQKEIIVKTLRENKHTVSMFGDGVNDILAMKSADVSISIRSGSRASRDIANLVLLNDDFDSLPEIVAQGRRVINNLQRTCSLFLTKTIFSISLNIFFIIFGLYTNSIGGDAVLWPFVTNNFYVWEMAFIGIAAFLLALEPNNERLEGGFIKNIMKKAVPNGLIIFSGILTVVLVSYFNFGEKKFSPLSDFITISVIYILTFAFLTLIPTCYKFNLYRLLVFIGVGILAIFMFLVSIFTGFNVLEIGSTINEVRYIYLLFIILAVSFALLAIEFIVMNLKTFKRSTK